MTTSSASTSARIDGAVLSTRHLSVAVGGRTLVRDLDLNVMPGQRWCLLGPNGSGKTTLLAALAGMHVPVQGEVRLGGESYDRIGPRVAAQKRALLLQARRFAFRISVRDCVSLGRHPHRSRFAWPSVDDDRRVADALATLDLEVLADRDVLELSGGEQQRTHLATILAQDPEVFLLDEPTTHLDLKHQSMLFAHLRSLCETRGKALVFSTHELSLAWAFATHAILLCGDGEVRVGPCRAMLEPRFLSALFGFPLALVEGAAGKAFVPQW